MSEPDFFVKRKLELEKDIEEARTCFFYQSKCLTSLLEGKFFLQEIPVKLVVEICKKMHEKSFAGIMRSSRWVNTAIEIDRSTFLLWSSKRIYLDYYQVKQATNDWIFEKFVANKTFVRFTEIEFYNFGSDIETVIRVLNYFGGASIFCKRLRLCNTVIIKDLFLTLEPIDLEINFLKPQKSAYLPQFLNFNFYRTLPLFRDELLPPIKSVDIYQESEQPSLTTILEKSIGKSEELIIETGNSTTLNELYTQVKFCLQNLSEMRNRQRIAIQLAPKHDVFELGSHFLQASEFPSLMSKDRSNFFYFLLFKQSAFGVTTATVCRTAGYMIWIAFTPTKEELRGFCKKAALPIYDDESAKATIQHLERGFAENSEGSYLEFEIERPVSEEIEEDGNEIVKMIASDPDFPLPHLIKEFPRTIQEANDVQVTVANLKVQLKKIQNILQIQRQWMFFLRKPTFIVDYLPEKFFQEVLKKMEVEAFIRMMRSAKWVKSFIEMEKISLFNTNSLILANLPSKCVLGIVKKMDPRPCARTLIASKWIHKLMEERSRLSNIRNIASWPIQAAKLKYDIDLMTREIDNRESRRWTKKEEVHRRDSYNDFGAHFGIIF